MAQDTLPVQIPFPEEGEQPKTYSEQLSQLNCVCSGGAIISPITLPSATVNLGDIIADHSRVLSNFASAYSVITIILRMIACIIDVLCAIPNPFAMISAMIKLFGTCLPELILIFPQFAIIAIILCYIKIVISIIEYILEVILPLIIDIIANVQTLIDAFESGNGDAQAAVAFKIVALIKEMFNVVGITSALAALFIMIKAIINLGVGIPCGGSGGSCSGCGDDQCPSVIQEDDLSGIDGSLIVLYGEDIFDYEIRFFSSSAQSSFLQIREFFPKGLNYNEMSAEDIPYILTVDGQDYAITSVDSGGTAQLFQIPNEERSDGYLSSFVFPPTALASDQVRFGTDTEFFDSSFSGRYLDISDRNESTSDDNSGTWYISSVIDAYNVVLDSDPNAIGSSTFSGFSSLNPERHITWKLTSSAPSPGGSKTFLMDINHNELIRHQLIGLGCHPSVKATRDATENRFPDAANVDFPEFPDLNAVVSDLNNCVTAIAPITVDSSYVLDNYQSIASGAAELEDCIQGVLGPFQANMLSYANQIYPRVLDRENSLFVAKPTTQIIGNNILISVTPLDIYGGLLSAGLPPGTIVVSISATAGSLSEVTEELDDDGNVTGVFTAVLSSTKVLSSTLTAQVGGQSLSDFDGSTLVDKTIEVEFIEKFRTGDIDDGPEPLGVGEQ